MSELLIGCGNSRDKLLCLNDKRFWTALTTLDHDPSCKPDVVHDLDSLPYPFEDDSFDEIHAYEVLEHCGKQGDWRFFFGQWSEFHRILKDGGMFFGTVPLPESVWAWGDPSHTRVIPLIQLDFLCQRFYEQVGATPTSDFRSCWSGNFEVVHTQETPDRQMFVLLKVKHE